MYNVSDVPAFKHKINTSNPWEKWLPIGAILLLSILVYVNTLRMDFVYDDLLQIKELPLIRDIRYIPRLFAGDMWQILGGKAPYYRPLFYTSFSLDYLFWKENPFGYHLTNILLHAAVSLLVYLLTRRIAKSRVAALAAGILFVVHPVHAEAVTWISARCDLLAAFFMLFSYFTFTIFLEKGKKAILLVSLVAFFMSLLSKEMAITLPLLVFFHVWCFTEASWKKKLVWPALYGVAALPYLLIRILVLDIQSWGSHPLFWKICTGIGLVVSYTRLLLFPANLKVFYNVPIQKIFLSPDVLVPFLLLSAIIATIIVSLKYDKRVFFCLLWIYVTLLPVSGFVTLLSPALMAERYLYIPSVGFCMAGGILFSKLLHAEERGWQLSRAVNLAGTAVIIILAVFTLRRNHAWENQHAFMVNMVKDAAGTEFGYYFLGTLYKEGGRADDALREFAKALALNPTLVEAHYSMGILYAGKGALNEAEKEFQLTLILSPKNVKAYNNLGAVYAMQGKMNEAVIQFNKALHLDPDDAFARENLEKVLSSIR